MDWASLLQMLLTHTVLASFIFSKQVTLRYAASERRDLFVFSITTAYVVLLYLFAAKYDQPLIFIVSGFPVGLLMAVFLAREFSRENIILANLYLLLMILFIWIVIQYREDTPGWIGHLTLQVWQPRHGIILLVFVLITFPLGELISRIMKPFTDQMVKEGQSSEGLKRAGLWIGILERALCYIFILSGHFAAIAWLVTAKSIFRVGPILSSGHKKETEYIFIGSMLSLGSVIALSLLLSWWLRLT